MACESHLCCPDCKWYNHEDIRSDICMHPEAFMGCDPVYGYRKQLTCEAMRKNWNRERDDQSIRCCNPEGIFWERRIGWWERFKKAILKGWLEAGLDDV